MTPREYFTNRLAHAKRRLSINEDTLEELKRLDKEKSQNVSPATRSMKKAIIEGIKRNIFQYKKEIRDSEKRLKEVL